MAKLPLTYADPVTSVFLRILAWEIYEAKRELKVKDVATEQLDEARYELGLQPLKSSGGRPRDFIQKLRKHEPPLISAPQTLPVPKDPKWETEWRMHYLPPHNLVRQLSEKPICKKPEPMDAKLKN